ncbi:MAG: lipid biosynthesis B12-binding/radical SAM protein [Nitrospirota bacterium]
MKVLLISVNNEAEPYPVAPIGVMYLARALKDKGHDVNIFDLCFVEDDLQAIKDAIKGFSPDVIGISIRNIDNLTYNKSVFYLPRIKKIVDAIRNYTSAPVVVGGSGFSIFSGEVLKYLNLDIGIVGDGEVAFPMYLDAMSNSGDIYHIPNLCYIKDDELKLNPLQYSHPNLLPDRSLLDNKKYLELGGMGNIQSKRGCPFKCAYCTYPGINGDRLRLREPGDVAEELKEMVSEYGIDYAFFIDDIFNIPEEHASAICEEIIRKGLKIDWTCFATPKGMTRELAGLMKEAGCKGVEFGTDACSERTLKGLNKHFTLDDIASSAECCKSVDLPNAHYIIIGGPGEDELTLNETLALFDKIKPTAIIALIGVRIYPNTGLHKRAIEENIIEKNRNLLEPVFYLTPEMDIEIIFQKISEHAEQRHNWIVPGLNIRCDNKVLTMLRQMGKRGPLWDMLAYQ